LNLIPIRHQRTTLAMTEDDPNTEAAQAVYKATDNDEPLSADIEAA